MNENFEEYLLGKYKQITDTVWTDGTEVFTIDEDAEWITPTFEDPGYWAYSVSNLDEEESNALIIKLSEVYK